eukprot:1160133-Pelagomonas_calceolata.AAC.2
MHSDAQVCSKKVALEHDWIVQMFILNVTPQSKARSARAAHTMVPTHPQCFLSPPPLFSICNTATLKGCRGKGSDTP